MIRGVLIDLDGTVYAGDRCLANSPRAIRRLRELNLRLLFLTNRSTKSPQAVADKLQSMDIVCRTDEILTSSVAAAKFLAAGSALWIGETGLRLALEEQGMDLVDWQDDPEEVLRMPPDYVVVGLDRQLNQTKVDLASRCIRSGARFIATNRDRKVNATHGIVSGAARTVDAVARAANTEPLVIGKPERPVFEMAIAQLGLPPEEILMVGDNLDTDILGGLRSGLQTALVLSGITTASDLEARRLEDREARLPQHVVEDLGELVDRLMV